jgi:hypothetical protein
LFVVDEVLAYLKSISHEFPVDTKDVTKIPPDQAVIVPRFQLATSQIQIYFMFISSVPHGSEIRTSPNFNRMAVGFIRKVNEVQNRLEMKALKSSTSSADDNLLEGNI